MTNTHDAARILKYHYNPDRDLHRNGPRVTWADRQLLELIEAQAARIDALEKRILRLEADLSMAEADKIGAAGVTALQADDGGRT